MKDLGRVPTGMGSAACCLLLLANMLASPVYTKLYNMISYPQMCVLDLYTLSFWLDLPVRSFVELLPVFVSVWKALQC